ncbi:hypothetical protein [Mycoplasma sp. 'Moose RK']|uniref:hypothetical protein n=1 Tax=Mycoplasma sp. 'Moose RK' TaxID=2780095 RepID=UPI001E2B0B88|nr:hypothetical protein [Mycoplasma sp. 'Moose RK']
MNLKDENKKSKKDKQKIKNSTRICLFFKGEGDPTINVVKRQFACKPANWIFYAILQREFISVEGRNFENTTVTYQKTK